MNYENGMTKKNKRIMRNWKMIWIKLLYSSLLTDIWNLHWQVGESWQFIILFWSIYAVKLVLQLSTLTFTHVRVHSLLIGGTLMEMKMTTIFNLQLSPHGLWEFTMTLFFPTQQENLLFVLQLSTLTGGVVSITIFNSFQYPQGFLLELQLTTLFYAVLQHVRVR